MTTLARERMMAETIPIKSGDTQPRSRRNHRSISDRIFRACTQDHEILGFESINAVGEGFEIVNQSDGLGLEHSGEFRGIDRPCKVGDLASSPANRSGHAKARAVHRDPFRFHKVRNDVGQASLLLAHVNFLDYLIKSVAVAVKCGEPGPRCADLSCEDHGSIFLHSRSSRASNSSASFGPHEPAA